MSTNSFVNDQRYVEQGFWSKVKRFLHKVPFVEDAIILYFCAIDSKTPIHARAIAFSALAYFILPIDLIPDTVPVAGFTDDAAAIAVAINALSPYISDEHREKAKAWLLGKLT